MLPLGHVCMLRHPVDPIDEDGGMGSRRNALNVWWLPNTYNQLAF